MHHHIDVLITLDIKVIDPQQVFKEVLLRTFKVQQIASVMQQAEAVEFVKIDLR